MLRLIADSGSSKTDWLLTDGEQELVEVRTAGINPVRDSSSIITHVVMDELIPQLPSAEQPSEVHFYGAGCMEPYSQVLLGVLESQFPQAEVSAESDLLGAARALCQDKPGIACILGTGSNSGLYDGHDITEHVSPLGFILGDEGSGAVLGRLLLGDVMKEMMPAGLRQTFLDEYQITSSEIIERVYRGVRPNQFLASFAPFLARHRTEAYVHTLLVNSFRQFLARNVAHYQRFELHVNFVGGIAYTFSDELRLAVAEESMLMGQILLRPIQKIAEYHQRKGK